MVQIVAAPQQRKSFAEEFGANVGGGFSKGIMAGVEHKMKSSLQSQKIAEQLAGKKELLQTKQDFLSNLLGGGQGQGQQSRGFAESLGNPQQEQGGFNPANISDADIAQAIVVDPQLGMGLQRMKDVALREARETKKEGKERESDLWSFNKDYIKGLDEAAEGAFFQQEIANEVESLLDTGNVDPSNVRTFLASKYGEDLPFLFTEGYIKIKILRKATGKRY